MAYCFLPDVLKNIVGKRLQRRFSISIARIVLRNKLQLLTRVRSKFTRTNLVKYVYVFWYLKIIRTRFNCIDTLFNRYPYILVYYQEPYLGN